MPEVKTDYTMAELRAICRELDITAARSFAETMERIEAAKLRLKYRAKYPQVAQVWCRRRESAWVKRLMGTTALYAHQPFPGPVVRPHRNRGTDWFKTMYTGRLVQALVNSTDTSWQVTGR